MGARLIRTVIIALLLALSAGEAHGQVPAPPEALEDIPVVLLVDLDSRQTLYARQPDLRFPPASVAKVMTTYVALDMMKAKQLFAHQSFTMSDQAWRNWHQKGSTMYINAGERVPVENLLRGITTISANDACIVLAEGAAGSVAAWLEKMNATARALGMRNSVFATPNGWPDENRTLVTARDLVTLGEALVTRHNDLYHHYFGARSMRWNDIEQTNHDPVTGVVQGADGIKTGFTNAAGYNFLGSAERDGRRLMMVVAGSRSGGQRARASRALLEWGFTAWRGMPLYEEGATVARARVQGGDALSVALVAPRRIAAALPMGGGAPKLTIRYKGPITAPIAAGARVAELEIAVPGLPPSRVPLAAAEAVETAGPIDRALAGLAWLFT
jgi:serine-type D-Ala-D-Ala carboxypeptidase (penicillin-binding protein 5/6)